MKITKAVSYEYPMGYDPNEPRDDKGQWTEGGDVASDHLPAEKVQQIRDAVEQAQQQAEPGQEVGIRMLPPDSPPVSPGEHLDPSGNWENGEHTGRSLDGTSVIGVRDMDKGIKDFTSTGYVGHKVAIVVGEGVGSGEDVGERILDHPKVISIIDVADKSK